MLAAESKTGPKAGRQSRGQSQGCLTVKTLWPSSSENHIRAPPGGRWALLVPPGLLSSLVSALKIVVSLQLFSLPRKPQHSLSQNGPQSTLAHLRALVPSTLLFLSFLQEPP